MNEQLDPDNLEHLKILVANLCDRVSHVVRALNALSEASAGRTVKTSSRDLAEALSPAPDKPIFDLRWSFDRAAESGNLDEAKQAYQNMLEHPIFQFVESICDDAPAPSR